MTEEQVAATVRDFEDRYAAAFNRRDVAALVELFTEEATILTEWGDVVAGRAAFMQGLGRAFAVLPGEIRIENTPGRSAALTEDVIVSHGTTDKYDGRGVERLVYTRVLVRRGGRQWLVAAIHIAEPSRRADPRAEG